MSTTTQGQGQGQPVPQRGTNAQKYANSNLNTLFAKAAPPPPGGSAAGSVRGYGGMLVLMPKRARSVGTPGAKLSVPKPVNLPSIKKEHAGNDPNTQLVPPNASGGWNKPVEEPPPVVQQETRSALTAGSNWASRPAGPLNASWQPGTRDVLPASGGKAPFAADRRLNPEEYPSLAATKKAQGQGQIVRGSKVPNEHAQEFRTWADDEREVIHSGPPPPARDWMQREDFDEDDRYFSDRPVEYAGRASWDQQKLPEFERPYYTSHESRGFEEDYDFVRGRSMGYHGTRAGDGPPPPPPRSSSYRDRYNPEPLMRPSATARGGTDRQRFEAYGDPPPPPPRNVDVPETNEEEDQEKLAFQAELDRVAAELEKKKAEMKVEEEEQTVEVHYELLDNKDNGLQVDGQFYSGSQPPPPPPRGTATDGNHAVNAEAEAEKAEAALQEAVKIKAAIAAAKAAEREQQEEEERRRKAAALTKKREIEERIRQREAEAKAKADEEARIKAEQESLIAEREAAEAAAAAAAEAERLSKMAEEQVANDEESWEDAEHQANSKAIRIREEDVAEPPVSASLPQPDVEQEVEAESGAAQDSRRTQAWQPAGSMAMGMARFGSFDEGLLEELKQNNETTPLLQDSNAAPNAWSRPVDVLKEATAAAVAAAHNLPYQANMPDVLQDTEVPPPQMSRTTWRDNVLQPAQNPSAESKISSREGTRVSKDKSGARWGKGARAGTGDNVRVARAKMGDAGVGFPPRSEKARGRGGRSGSQGPSSGDGPPQADEGILLANDRGDNSSLEDSLPGQGGSSGNGSRGRSPGIRNRARMELSSPSADVSMDVVISDEQDLRGTNAVEVLSGERVSDKLEPYGWGASIANEIVSMTLDDSLGGATPGMNARDRDTGSTEGIVGQLGAFDRSIRPLSGSPGDGEDIAKDDGEDVLQGIPPLPSDLNLDVVPSPPKSGHGMFPTGSRPMVQSFPFPHGAKMAQQIESGDNTETGGPMNMWAKPLPLSFAGHPSAIAQHGPPNLASTIESFYSGSGIFPSAPRHGNVAHAQQGSVSGGALQPTPPPLMLGMNPFGQFPQAFGPSGPFGPLPGLGPAFAYDRASAFIPTGRQPDWSTGPNPIGMANNNTMGPRGSRSPGLDLGTEVPNLGIDAAVNQSDQRIPDNSGYSGVAPNSQIGLGPLPIPDSVAYTQAPSGRSPVQHPPAGIEVNNERVTLGAVGNQHRILGTGEPTDKGINSKAIGPGSKYISKDGQKTARGIRGGGAGRAGQMRGGRAMKDRVDRGPSIRPNGSSFSSMVGVNGQEHTMMFDDNSSRLQAGNRLEEPLSAYSRAAESRGRGRGARGAHPGNRGVGRVGIGNSSNKLMYVPKTSGDGFKSDT